jgi:hypothetical protein
MLDGLSNAIMRDERVFHIVDTEFINKYNRQGENTYFQAVATFSLISE